MTNAQVESKLKVGFSCALLFVIFFPVLHFLTHPFSVLYGTDYTPLVLRLDDFYLKTGLLSISLIATPLLLVAVIFLMQKQRFSFVRALTYLFTPFLVALVIQYFISVQLDNYLRFPRIGHPVPWDQVFQPGYMLDCSRLAIAYVGICVMLYFVSALVWRKLSKKDGIDRSAR